MSTWRPVARVACRSAWRHRGRSALVLLLIFLPTYAAALLIVAWSNLGVSRGRDVDWRLGKADLAITAGDERAVLASAPDGTRAVTVLGGSTIIHIGGRYRTVDYVSADTTDALIRDMYVLRTGRAPRPGRGEIAVTTAMGVGIGDTVEAGLPVRPLRVVGIIDVSASLRRQAIVCPAGEPLTRAPSRTLMLDLPPGAGRWLPRPQNSAGLSFVDRTELSRPDPDAALTRAAAVAVVVGFAAAQVVVMVAATFTVGVRRRRRQLTLLSATGASGRDLVRMVLAEGAVLGLLAGVAGVLLAVATFGLVRPLVERLADHPVAGPGPEEAWQLIAATLVAGAVGTLAALGPAVAAARSVRTAVPAPRARGIRLLPATVLLAGSGIGLGLVDARPGGSPVLLAVAAVLFLLAAVSALPALVGVLGRLGLLLPVAGRLAVRHAARHRYRTAAAAAVALAAIAGTAGLGALAAARDTSPPELRLVTARPGQVLLPASAVALLDPPARAEVTRLLRPVDTVALTLLPPTVRVGRGRDESDSLPGKVRVAVGGPEVIKLVTGRNATAAEVGALRRGGAVTFRRSLVVHGSVRLFVGDDTIDLPEVTAPAGPYASLPAVVISPVTATKLGLVPVGGPTVLDTGPGADPAAANSVLLAAQATHAIDAPAPLRVARSSAPSKPPTGTMFIVLAVVSIVVTLVASVIAVSLAGAESTGDAAIMAAVGASPGRLRRIGAADAAVIGALGALLGTAAGLVPAIETVAYRNDLAWRSPWLAVVLTLVVPPLLALGTGLLLRRPARPAVRRPT